MSKAEKWVQSLLKPAGIKLNGPNTWDPQVHDTSVYWRIALGGEKAIGDTYVEGKWSCEALDECIARICWAGTDTQFSAPLYEAAMNFVYKHVDMHDVKKSLGVAQNHYDLGADFYAPWLDMLFKKYTCADWSTAGTLEDAQKADLEFACQSLGLRPGQTVLDIGCGEGGFALYAAMNYDVRVIGVTNSKEHAASARECCKHLPVKIIEDDYRNIDVSVDHVVSFEMIEAVGHRYLPTFMQKVHDSLKPGGNFFLQAICGRRSVYRTHAWIHSYIFENGMLPSMAQLAQAAENRLKMLQCDEIGHFYDRTLMEWNRRFDAAWEASPAMREKYEALFRERWPGLALRGGTFKRMWNFYLLTCAGASRRNEDGYSKNRLYRILYTKEK